MQTRFFRTIVMLLVVVMSATISIPVAARQPQQGYRGFVEWANSVRTDKFADFYPNGTIGIRRETALRSGISTSHGYQINSLFFAGAGVGVEFPGKGATGLLPAFLEGRADFQWGRLTPFADLRAGVNMGVKCLPYISPSIGYRFNWGRKLGLNLGIGMTLAGYRTKDYDITFPEPDWVEFEYVGESDRFAAYFSFRIGFDF